MILSKTQTHARQNRQSFHTNNMQWTKMPSLLGLINPPASIHNKHHTHSLKKQLAVPMVAETKRPNTMLTQGQVSEPAVFGLADAENQR